MIDSQSGIDTAKPYRLAAGSRGAGLPARLIARLCFLLFGLVTLAVVSGGPARADTRSLKIYHVHTGEKAVIVFKRNGHYVPAGLKKLDHILRDWRKNKETRMDPRLFDLLWTVYRKSGSHDYIHIICGYRTDDTNAMLRGRSRSSGVAKKSQHILGKAIDYYIPDVKLEKLREIGMSFQVGGVGYYPNSGSPFVHMDTGWVRAWPRMSRQQLVRLFPDGKTLHLPPDGKPLAGYQQALASYKQRVNDGSIVVAGGGVSGSHRSGGNLLAALFGGGQGDEDEEAADATATPGQSRQAPTRVAAVDLPDRAPLPGVRAEAAPLSSSPDAPGASLAASPQYADLLALASVPVPQVAPGREIQTDTPADAAAALVAEAAGTGAAPVPTLRPELVAYAPTDDAMSFPTPAKVTVPSLRPAAIVAAARDRMMRKGTHSAAQALAVRLKAKAGAAPRRYATLPGDSVRGGRLAAVGEGSSRADAALTEQMIARWARRQEGFASRVDFTRSVTHRTSRATPEPRVSENMRRMRQRPVDPQRFAALDRLFTTND